MLRRCLPLGRRRALPGDRHPDRGSAVPHPGLRGVPRAVRRVRWSQQPARSGLPADGCLPRRGRAGSRPRHGGRRGEVKSRPLHVCLVTANTFEYDSRTLRAARALTADGHRVTVVALADARLPASQTPDAATLPPSRGGAIEGLRGPLRRGLEILAYRRRIGPWSDAAVAAANDADVFSAKALVALPVVHRAARTTGTRFVYDIADLHVDSGRLAGMPGPVRSYLRRRERGWMHDAAGLTAVTAPLAKEVARRFAVPLPAVVMNC